jgi:MerR family transcriptional regulator/heat shock protein HspR
MYSDKDIARLRLIKHLVDDLGLNLAGVRVALRIQDTILNIREQLASADLNASRRKQLLKTLDESLKMLGTVIGINNKDIAAIGDDGQKGR